MENSIRGKVKASICIDHVLYFEVTKAFTVVHFDSGNEIRVFETIDEINNMINGKED
jgi:hypothetical protein